MQSEVAPKVLLIGGTSHAGKSTVAGLLADQLGWDRLSTDQLARHPGRPWRNGESLPQDVVRYYTESDTAVRLAQVVQHYTQNVYPIVSAIVASRLANPFDRGLVLEGSAVWPSEVASGLPQRCAVVYLVAEERALRDRIGRSAGYASRKAEERLLIDAFIARAVAMQTELVAIAAAAGLSVLEITGDATSTARRILATFFPQKLD